MEPDSPSRSLRKLDSVDRILDLEAIGRRVGEDADFGRELADPPASAAAVAG